MTVHEIKDTPERQLQRLEAWLRKARAILRVEAHTLDRVAIDLPAPLRATLLEIADRIDAIAKEIER